MSESDLDKKLEDLLDNQIAHKKRSAKLARSFSVMSSSLIKREEKRLAKKLGKSHPRIASLQVKGAAIAKSFIKANKVNIKDNMTKPVLKADEALFQGLMLDENNVGVESLNVFLVDEKNKPVKGLKATTTNADGSYLIRVPDSVLVDTKKTYGVVVESKNKKVIFKKDNIKLSLGKVTVGEGNINRAKLIRS